MLSRLTRSATCLKSSVVANSHKSLLSKSISASPFKITHRNIATKANKAKGDIKVPFLRGFKFHRTDGFSDTKEALTNKEELLEFYRDMVYYRRFEIVADTMYKARFIRGFCHLYDGQEAVLTGMEAVLDAKDSVITAYRDHCHQIARGDTGDSAMAELFGKQTGCAKGKGGSMHMYYPKNNFFGGNGIVGAQTPLGAGLAFAHKYKKDGHVAVAAYGDGASNQGQLMEAANMAQLWKLPVIFLCENNHYGMGTSTQRSSMNTNFYQRGDVIPGIWFDGMDVLASKRAFQFAVEHAKTKGPIFMEGATYRYHGHSMSDPGISYRKREEVEQMRNERDPIERIKNVILSLNVASEAELKAIDKDIRKQVDGHVEFAKNSAELPPKELFFDVYRNEVPPFIRTVDIRESVDLAKQSL